MTRPAGSLVLHGTTVVDTHDGSLTPDVDVHVEQGIITAISPSGALSNTVPGALPGRDAATVVDARDAYVVPGYLDMHAHPLAHNHAPDGALALMLANGVTGFRQMNGSRELLRDRRNGALNLPLDSPDLLSTCGDVLLPTNGGTDKAAVKTVRQQHADGADFIKVGLLTPATFFAAQAEANRLGIPIAGHLPAGIDVRLASRHGMQSIEHLGPGVGVLAACADHEDAIRDQLSSRPPLKLPPVQIPFVAKLIAAKMRKIVVNPLMAGHPADVTVLRDADETFNEDKARALAAIFAADGTWHCPTLIRVRTQQFGGVPEYANDPNLRYLAAGTLQDWQEVSEKFRQLPEHALAAYRANYAVQLRLVNLFDQAGVKMLAGSDVCGAAWELPGFSLHQEFDQLAAAGLTPLRILQMTTLNGAEFLGRTGVIGSVDPGKQADLVLLGANPIEDAANLHAITGVVRAGRYYDRAALEALKEGVARARSVR